MARRAGTKVEPVLITHLTVAALCSIDTETLRDWVGRGIFPRPHSVFERTWLYKKSVVDHFIESGRWPEEASFIPKEG